MLGFLSCNTYTADSGEGIAVARFESEEAPQARQIHTEHQQAQDMGRWVCYQEYWVQVCSTLCEYRCVARDHVPGAVTEPLPPPARSGRGVARGGCSGRLNCR
jgi:hypothetical protein